MRMKTRSSMFIFLYPGLMPNSDVKPGKDAVSIAIPDEGEWVSICTEDGCAVFYDPQDLRHLADTLYEAAYYFDEFKKKPKVRPGTIR